MPKLSIALFGRNDNYVKNYLEIMKFSIRSIQRALENIDYEILLLDYNPPKDKPLLSECFPNNEYPRIKHVVFSHEDHLEFIDCHLKNGAKLKYKQINIKKRIIYEINFIIAFAMNLSVKYSSGDYILSTGTDNIFPIQFGEFIKELEPNILYRTITYKIKEQFKKIRKILFYKFDKIVNDCILVPKVNFKKYGINFKIKKTIWSSSGNFILMDKNSWGETGGYIPTINKRPSNGDSQIVFHSIICDKKIKCASFPIFNIDELSIISNKKTTIHSNYIVKKNDIKYNHLKEVGKNRCGKTLELAGTRQWQTFRKFAMRSHLEPGKEYFIEIDYKKRLEEIKQLFKSFLPDKFLLY